MYFATLYIHTWRSLYYGSYKAPREVLWLTGMLLMAMTMVAAFAGYEVALYAASFVLGGGNAAFAPHVIARIAAINAVALAGLLAVHRLGLVLGLRLPTGRTDLVRV